MDELKVLTGVALFAIAVVVALILKRLSGRRYPSGALPYYSKQYLLSKGEAAFFSVLRSALPRGLYIAPKVRVSDLLGCDRAAWKQGFGGRISQKHVDFVVIDERSAAFVLVIELDDKTHRQRDRRQRDEFLDRAFAKAGVAMLHVVAAPRYDAAALRNAILEHLSAMDAR